METDFVQTDKQANRRNVGPTPIVIGELDNQQELLLVKLT